MLKISSQIEKFESRSDNTWKLIIGTQELDSKDVAELAMLKGKQGWFVFNNTGINEADIPTEQVDFANEKTPAQRQRGILYRIWEQSTVATRGEFETFYKNKVNAINEKLKEKLV
jgi:hypothetical protein